MPVRLVGQEAGDWTRSCVVMGNHQSMIDAFSILSA
jgi:hypothetical protein